MEEIVENHPMVVDEICKEFCEHGNLIHSLHMIDIGRRLAEVIKRHGATLDEVIQGITFACAEQVMISRFDFGIRQ